MSQTISARISKDTHDILREYCNQLGCTMNDFVRKSVERELSDSPSFQNCHDCDEETHKTMDWIIQNIHDSDSSTIEEDDFGRIERAEIIWVRKEKPKATVTIID